MDYVFAMEEVLIETYWNVNKEKLLEVQKVAEY